ncbi:hypothetical protein LAZ40_04840 [Cereibacter sphaeroides]|uniref:hypothetical protein n=1 Tax=Cereibacter sphaeroides TaxID=1063 RepID=UPI001F16F04D|nr:hypothetical protein [Cereibacter sphaeroides]MCE6958383.1 hypothetical protein [Cereibacter sphaeroides]MCE6972250.1 hypothetical protein [Cereibacter sphaeroides]
MTRGARLEIRFDWMAAPFREGGERWTVEVANGNRAEVYRHPRSSGWCVLVAEKAAPGAVARCGRTSREAAQRDAEARLREILERQLAAALASVSEFLPLLRPDPEQPILPMRGRPGAGYAIVPLQPTPEAVGAWHRIRNGHHFHDEPEPTADERCDYAAYRALVRHARLAQLGLPDTEPAPAPVPAPEPQPVP